MKKEQEKKTVYFKDELNDDFADNNIEKKDEKLFLIFNVSKELYGIDVSGVNNIIMMPAITFIPKTPECYEGVINQRGEIIYEKEKWFYAG